MSNSTQRPATPPLLLRTNPDPGSGLPYIDSPESLLVVLARLTGAYFEAGDFPHDAINTALFRIESLAVVMQCHLEAEDTLTPKDLSNAAWALEGLATDALTMLRIWGRHGTVNPGGEPSGSGACL